MGRYAPKNFGGVAGTLDATELTALDGVTAGTAKASRAAVLGATKNLDTICVAQDGFKMGASGAEVAVTSTPAELNILHGVTATAADLNKAAGAVGAFVQNVRVLATVEEVNAGKVLVATPTGKVARIVDAEVTAVGGAVGAVTTVDIKIGATVKITYAQANLLENALLRLDSTGVTLLAAGASFTAGADGEDITAIKAGDDITTATHVLFVLSFVFEDA